MAKGVMIMNFTPIDLQTWPRGQMFYYFSQMAPAGYSMTIQVDVTALRKTLKEAGRKFFPAYLWLVTKNLNRQTEFRVAEKDGVLGFYDVLNCYNYGSWNPCRLWKKGSQSHLHDVQRFR